MKHVLHCIVLLLVAACGETLPRTQVMLVLDAEPGVRQQTREVHLVIRGGTGAMAQWQERLDRSFTLGSTTQWPLEIALVPLSGDASRVYEATATALSTTGDPVARVRAVSGYQSGKTLTLRLLFEDACRTQVDTCNDTQTCRNGQCVAATVDVTSLKPYKPGAEVDAGADGGAMDGSCGSNTHCNATLTNLTVVNATLAPAFSDDAIEYSASVGLLASTVTLVPTASSDTMISIEGDMVASGSPWTSPTLNLGANAIAITASRNGQPSAVYTLTVTRAQRLTQDAYLKASNTGERDDFGLHMAIDGDTMVVGAWREDGGATGVNGDESDNSVVESGAAYVFVRRSGVWSQQAYLKASNPGMGDRFGIRVAISGETIAVGAAFEDSAAVGVDGNQEDESAIDSGAVYVFVRTNETWSQQAFLKASNTGAGDEFGMDVGLLGESLVVGAGGEDSSAQGINGDQTNNDAIDSGAVYVFGRVGKTWSQQAYLKASNTGEGDGFGRSLALDDRTLAVGAHGECSNAVGVDGDQLNDDATESGAVYVFTRSGAAWTQQAYVKASNSSAGDNFGTVALQGDTLAVGAAYEDGGSRGTNGNQSDRSVADSGAVYVFGRSASTWSQSAYLKSSNTGTVDDRFGIAVALSGDWLAVGAKLEDSDATGFNGDQENDRAQTSGAVFLFEQASNGWAQHTYIKASNAGAGDAFGYNLAFHDGVLMVGAPIESSGATGSNGNQSDDSAPSSGAVYIFR